MTLEFQLTEDDYVEAQVAHTRKTLRRRSFLLLPIIIIASFVMVSVTQPEGEGSRIILPLGYVVGFSALVIFWQRSGFTFRRQFRKIKALHTPIRVVVEDDGIISGAASGQGKTLWKGYEDWRETKNLFLLYTQPNLFYIVPKRAIQPDAAPFRELLITRIPRT